MDLYPRRRTAAIGGAGDGYYLADPGIEPIDHPLAAANERDGEQPRRKEEEL